jgi:hypothetical protein
MTKFVANQPLEMEAWSVAELLKDAERWQRIPGVIESAHREGVVEFHPERKTIDVKLADGVVEVDERYMIIYCEDQFSIQLVEVFDQNHTSTDKIRYLSSGSWSGAGWLGSEEINHRFGFHKARIENGGDSIDHVTLRKEFIKFAGMLDQEVLNSREKALAMTALEEASMWFHKALARDGELVKD